MNTSESNPKENATASARTPIQIQNILVPLDFSGVSRQALDYAVPLAGKWSAKITLIHVVPPQIFYPDAGMVLPDEVELTDAARRTMSLRAVELVPPALLKESVVRNGHPAAEITRFAREHDVDLIVMTTHGRSGLAHVFLGSVTEWVMRHASCPVLVVRQK